MSAAAITDDDGDDMMLYLSSLEVQPKYSRRETEAEAEEGYDIGDPFH